MNIMKTDSTDFHSCNFFTLMTTSTVFCSDVLEVLKLPDNILLVLIFQIYYLFGKKKLIFSSLSLKLLCGPLFIHPCKPWLSITHTH